MGVMILISYVYLFPIEIVFSILEDHHRVFRFYVKSAALPFTELDTEWGNE